MNLKKNSVLSSILGKILAFAIMFTSVFANVQFAFAADLTIIDAETGNGTWSFLSSSTDFSDSNLAASAEADKLVSSGDYVDSNKVTHSVYVLGGAANSANTEYNYGDIKFLATAENAITYRSYKGFGRINFEPGTGFSVPVRGMASFKIDAYVDLNATSGDAAATAEAGAFKVYADDVEIGQQTPVAASTGTATTYSFSYSGEQNASVLRFENTGTNVLAVNGVRLAHIVQTGGDTQDCSEPDSFVASGNIWVLGDSTVCEYTKENTAAYNYRQGWGMRLGDYLESMNVKNIAGSGRSARDFTYHDNTKGQYSDMIANMKTGDYVIIQFGHNDEKVEDDYITPQVSSSGTSYNTIYSVPISKIGNGTLDWTKSTDGLVDDGKGNQVPCFEWFLYNNYIKPAKEAGAQPILATPIVRRSSSSGGGTTGGKHEVYSEAIRKLAADYNVPLVDLYASTMDYWNETAATGTTATEALHALSASGSVDNTHLSQEGASVVAKMVAEQIKKTGNAMSEKITATPEKVTEITLDSKALQTNYYTNTFKTIGDAMKFIETCNTPTTEEERVTLNFEPGTYREQVFVNAPYLTFKNAKSQDYGDVVITWYYGIGYKYYSVDENGFYSKDKMKENKANETFTAPVKNWGHTVRVNESATGFKADNITFESSFGRYVTQEEIDDGVTPAVGGSEFYTDGTTKPDRASLGAGSKAVQGKDYRERSCAFFILADRAEMNGCYFVSEQDTLGTNYQRQYYKNCVIEGTVDYICGTGSSIFDECELRWGTTAAGSGGYICAPKGNYLFYKCKVTGQGNNSVAGNKWARPWGGQDSNATMFKTVIGKNSSGVLNIGGAAYSDMSGKSAAEAKFFEYGSVDENGNAIDLSGRLKNTVQPYGTAVYDPWLMLQFNPYNYTTGEYGIENSANVRFTVDDWDPMNRAERMLPIKTAIKEFDLASADGVEYDEANEVYKISTTSFDIPEIAHYESKIESNSKNLVITGKNVSVKKPLFGSEAEDAVLTLYVREADSDEYGDKRTINVKILPETSDSPEDGVKLIAGYVKADLMSKYADDSGKIIVNSAMDFFETSDDYSGYNFEWNSGNSAISGNGEVIRPAFGEGDVTGDIQCIVTDKANNVTADFVVGVTVEEMPFGNWDTFEDSETGAENSKGVQWVEADTTGTESVSRGVQKMSDSEHGKVYSYSHTTAPGGSIAKKVVFYFSGDKEKQNATKAENTVSELTYQIYIPSGTVKTETYLQTPEVNYTVGGVEVPISSNPINAQWNLGKYALPTTAEQWVGGVNPATTAINGIASEKDGWYTVKIVMNTKDNGTFESGLDGSVQNEIVTDMYIYNESGKLVGSSLNIPRYNKPKQVDLDGDGTKEISGGERTDINKIEFRPNRNDKPAEFKLDNVGYIDYVEAVDNDKVYIEEILKDIKVGDTLPKTGKYGCEISYSGDGVIDGKAVGGEVIVDISKGYYGGENTIGYKTSVTATISGETEQEYIQGDFDGDKNVTVADASLILEYVLNPNNEKFAEFTEEYIDKTAIVTEGEFVSARDVAEVLQKALNSEFKFSRSNG